MNKILWHYKLAASTCLSVERMQNAAGDIEVLLRALLTSLCTAIHFSCQGDSHYRLGNQLLLLHYAIFMKHLANGLRG